MSVNIHELLTFAVKHRASDIHLGAGEVPAVRIDGDIRRLDVPALSKEDALRLAYSIMNEKQKAVFEEELELDFSIGLKNLCRFRVNVFTHAAGIGVALRQIPERVLSLEEIGAPKVFQRISEYNKGLVLVTGPTGVGKSTTIAAMVDHINKARPYHIITIEDPVEFIHTPVKAIMSQREVGTHTHSFAKALRSALREDPDVIVVGELRDLETVSLAITAAETGHLVFGTLHTNSAPETIDRIVDSYPHAQQDQVRSMLSTSLQAVVTQMLMKPKTGKGRVAVHEIMLCNAAIRNLIRENKNHQMLSTMQSARAEGMQTLEMALKALVQRGRVTKEQAIAVSGNPRMFDGDDAAVRRTQTRPTPTRS